LLALPPDPGNVAVPTGTFWKARSLSFTRRRFKRRRARVLLLRVFFPTSRDALGECEAGFGQRQS
jgi:hypothetical protein